MSVTLKDFLRLDEEKSKINKVIAYIVRNYKEDEVISKVEKVAVDKYVPSNWEEEAETELQWYEKNGQNQAEEDVIQEIISKAKSKIKENLSSSEIADIQNWFYNAYDL